MKKFYSLAFAAIAALSVVLSCTKMESSVDNTMVLKGQTTISATLSDIMTKVAFNPVFDGNGKAESLALVWADGDILRVYNHADRTQYSDFTLDAASVGTKTGKFVGTPVSAASYDVEVLGTELDYAVQSQPSDGAVSSLKYFANAIAVADLSEVSFTDYSSVLAISAKMPEGVAAAVSSVEITASEPIFNGGKSLSVVLSQKGDAGNDGVLNFFASLPLGSQTIAEGTSVLVRFNAPETEHTVYTRYVELGAASFAAGKLNTISLNATESDKHAGAVSCDGTTAEKAYLIGDKYQMQAVNSLMTADATTFFKMVDDVDLAGINWTPLNGTSPYTNAIDFDGADHKILNLTTDGSKRNSSFAAVLIGKLSNVTFDKADIEGGSNYAAVVAAYLGYGETKGYCNNVTVSDSKVKSTAIVGGFAAVGQLVGEVTACGVTGTEVTSAAARIGGFIGSLVAFDKISASYAENVTVHSDQYSCAGFIGQLAGTGTISGCHSTGSVDAGKSGKNYSFAGGFVGDMASATIQNCYSTCSVAATGKNSGGLVGNMQAGNIEGSYASGAVNVIDQNAGGLVGSLKVGTLTRCYATGDVTTPGHYAGGLVGVTTENAEIRQCYAAGTLNGNANRRGGIIGNVTTGTATVSNCYSTCPITCKSYSGTFIGGIEAGTTVSVTNSYGKATIAGHEDAACVFTGLAGGTISCTGYVGWNVSNRKNWSYNVTSATAPAGNYMGTEGTISAKAKEFGWDETIWDLSGDDPKLK